MMRLRYLILIHFKTSALFAFTLGFGVSIILASFRIIVLPPFHDLE